VELKVNCNERKSKWKSESWAFECLRDREKLRFMRKGKIRVLIHQIRVRQEIGNYALFVIWDWRLEIALRDYGWRLWFEIGASTRLVSLRNICVLFFGLWCICGGFYSFVVYCLKCGTFLVDLCSVLSLSIVGSGHILCSVVPLCSPLFIHFSVMVPRIIDSMLFLFFLYLDVWREIQGCGPPWWTFCLEWWAIICGWIYWWLVMWPRHMEGILRC